MRPILTAMAFQCLLATTAQADFKLQFSGWDDIPLCTNGSPNIVGNPAFKLTGLPAGTTSVQFKLTDLDVPQYNHGGSKRLSMSQDGTLPAGSFTYKSPCPPNGSHTYEWRATARKGGKVLGKATVSQKYPK